jgi:hypothetical protein
MPASVVSLSVDSSQPATGAITSVMHVIPEVVLANRHHGTYKDIVSRIRWFEKSAAHYRQVLITDDQPSQLGDDHAAPICSHALIEYSYYPRILRELRRRYPQCWIGVRAINIEPLQHFDNHGWTPLSRLPWLLYGMSRLFAADLTCKRLANAIYSINSWENRAYWSRLPGSAQIEWLPYHCPQHLIGNPQGPGAAEGAHRSLIACLPTSQKNRKSEDLVQRFEDFARHASQTNISAKWQFVMTGDLTPWNRPATAEVQRLGMVADLSALMQRCRAVAVLSPLGYGFKTTIGDAIANGCLALVHPTLAARCPQELMPAIIPVDTNDSRSVTSAFDRLDSMTVPQGLDDLLRQRNEALLTRDFGTVIHHRPGSTP